MTAGRDLGVRMIAGAQGGDLLFPKAASAASPLLRTTAVAAAQWPRAGMTAMETAAQGVMPAAALLLLTAGRMTAPPQTVEAPAPEMKITIMLVTIVGGVSPLIIRRGGIYAPIVRN
jgi:hypothetical protein